MTGDGKKTCSFLSPVTRHGLRLFYGYEEARGRVEAGGGDGYTMFKGARLLIEPENAQVEPAVVMNLIAADKQIAPKEDGRIRREDQ